jgi:alkaline phosphatase D
MDRRTFVLSLGALAASPVLARFSADPFSLGVASGYPTGSSVVLWTRLMHLLEPGPVRVRWEVAEDEAMRKIVSQGEALAEPDWAHSVHVEVPRLSPDRWYWYRFLAGDAQSAVGRTRTAPARDAAVARLRFAFASCQQYEHGYFGAYRHIVADAPDLLAFLGDYIYEASWGRDRVRHHGTLEAFTLEDYRARYALYKGDADLQAAHAACPWIVTWDDHEVENDYGSGAGGAALSPGQFMARRTAAYRAYYEHMPLPPTLRPAGAGLRLHADVAWGRLARFCVLDNRQHRSVHACAKPRKRGGPATVVDPELCLELADPSRTMLGQGQESWLESVLAGSDAAWNVLAQQTRMAQWDTKVGPGRSAWTDGWDGYPLSRRRLLEFLQARQVRNPVAIGGDVHAFHVAQLKADFDDAAAPVIASEFVGTSLTSHGPPTERLAKLMPENPHMLFADGNHRGYVRVDVTPQVWRADLRAMASVTQREAGCTTLASYAVESGKAGPVRA